MLLAAVPLASSPLAPSTLKWAILGLLASVVTFLWLMGGCGRPFRPLPTLLLPLVALLLVSEISLLQAINPHYGLQHIAFLLMLCLVYLTVAYTCGDHDARGRLVRTLTLTLLGVSLFSFAACALADASASHSAAETLFRLFGNTNYGAAYLLTGIPLALGLYLASRDRLEKVVWGITAFLSTALLTLSMVRGAWVSIWFGFGVLAWVVWRGGDRPGLVRPPAARAMVGPMLLIGSAVGLGVVLWPFCLPGVASFGERIASLVDPAAGSLQVRLAIWQGTLRMIRDHLWMGVGAGNFPLAFVPYRDAAIYQNPGMQVEHPHNEVLNALAELGPAGLLVILWLLVRVVRLGRALARRADLRTEMLGGILGGLAAAAAYANLFYVVQVPASAMNVAVLLGLLDAMDRGSSEEAHGPRVRLSMLLPGLLILGVLWVHYFLRPLAGEAHYFLAEEQFREERMEAGLTRLDRSLRWNPRSYVVRYRRAVIFFSLGRYAETIQEAREVLRLHPQMEVAYGLMGSAYLNLGYTGRAKEIFHQAVRLNPNYPHALNNLGVLAAREGRLVEAEALLLRATEVLGRKDMSPFANLANVYELSGRLPEALTMMESAVAIKPDLGANWYHLARLRVLNGDLPGAYEPLARAIALSDEWRARAAEDAVFTGLRQRDPRVRALIQD
ncbi:MAG: O-antigen ligase family protein [candidate division NC10 bacterium]|nr:O-antigen ligase family protein [candidate division NC10 bacterium]